MNTEFCFCGKRILQSGRCEGGHTQGQRTIQEARQRAKGGVNPPPQHIGDMQTGPEPTSSLLDAALAYAARGWAVFPCEPCGKKPLTANGFKDATIDEKTVRAWWVKWPDANIGSPMGESRIVIDMDGPEADVPMKDLERKHGPLPKTLEAKTGRGRHLYFNPNGANIKPSAGVLGPHLDVRASGSYAIIPPSVHANGTRYEWANDVLIAILPEAWRELLSSPERPKGKPQTNGGKIPEGQRNQHLTSLAGSMRRRGMGEGAIEAALLKENQERCNPPLPDAEVKAIVQSVSRYPANPEDPLPIPGVLASEVKPEKVQWLWDNRIPLGKITIFDGDPGLAKSTVSLDLAARLTNGWRMPDGTNPGCGTAGAVVVSLEDGKGDTIRPRLEAAGAILENIRIVNTIAGADGIERTPTLPGDLPAIELAARNVDAKMVILDPFVAMLGAETNSYRDQDIRRVLAPIAEFAEKLGVTVICIRHLNKSGGQNAKYRGGGSIGITGAARATFLFGEKPGEEGRYVFAPVKGNLWRGKPESLEYAIKGVEIEIEGEKVSQPVIEWGGASEHSAASLLAQPGGAEESNTMTDAKTFLNECLKDGSKDADAVFSEARRARVSERSLYRAKAALGIVSKKEGIGEGQHWIWARPNIA